VAKRSRACSFLFGWLSSGEVDFVRPLGRLGVSLATGVEEICRKDVRILRLVPGF